MPLINLRVAARNSTAFTACQVSYSRCRM